MLEAAQEAVTGIGGGGFGGVLDLILVGGIVLGAVQGYMRGGVELIGSMLGVVIGGWAGATKAEKGAELVQQYVDIPEQTEVLMGFVVVFFAVQLMARGVTIALSHGAGLLGMGLPNRIAGSALGGFKAAITASIVLAIAGQLGLPQPQTRVESQWYQPVRQTLPVAWNATRDVFPGIGRLSSTPDRVFQAVREGIRKEANEGSSIGSGVEIASGENGPFQSSERSPGGISEAKELKGIIGGIQGLGKKIEDAVRKFVDEAGSDKLRPQRKAN
jgi:uncharacterized membrane protein required for colicin V production